ncbi:MAG: hypothetical protein JG781_1165 [Peptococcaceae bacterium]|nr:hypothetical protein [Peptococcaceae bacterium]
MLNGISYLAVIAALYVIKLRPLPALSECLIFGLGLASLSLVKVIWLFLPLLVLIGFGMMLLMASSNTILQTISDDDKRGRVMSFYTISLMGMHPLGSL